MPVDVENARIQIQTALDLGKTPLQRNEMGQFATPKKLADAITRAALRYLPTDEKVAFLEPSIGTGSFYSALLDSIDATKIVRATGFEIDEHYALPAQTLWKSQNLDYRIGDFLEQHAPELEHDKYNLIISNPPYVRHHHLKNRTKDLLSAKVTDSFGIRLSGLSGLYCYFMTLSALWLRKSGISVWLIPGEFLDVNYGEVVKAFLKSKVRLLRIHRFNPESVQFSDALVTSVVVFYTTGQTDGVVDFTTGEDICNPETTNHIELDLLVSSQKWSHWFFSTVAKSAYVRKIGDYFKVKRGIATGSNKHFILGAEQAKALCVPTQFLRPILPSPRYIKQNIIERDAAGNPVGIESQYLLDITLPPSRLGELPATLIEYLRTSEEEIGANYLVSKRTPWYRQEAREQCPFLMTYMGRNSSEPFRLLLNLTNAVATNVYLMVYPTFDWKSLAKQDTNFLQRLHSELLQIAGATYIGSGRVYGGGLFKLEPKELMNTPIDGILSAETVEQIESTFHIANQLSLFEPRRATELTLIST